jgi:chromosome segregation ATPase
VRRAAGADLSAANATIADLKQKLAGSEAEAERLQEQLSQLNARAAALEIELADVRRVSDADVSAANATIADLRQSLAGSVAEGERLREQLSQLNARDAALAAAIEDERFGEAAALSLTADPVNAGAARPPQNGERIGDRLAEAAGREQDFNVRVLALAAARREAEAALRAARSERDALARDMADLREALTASERRAQAVIDGDKSLRQAIARLGREIVEAQASELNSAGRSLASDLTL